MCVWGGGGGGGGGGVQCTCIMGMPGMADGMDDGMPVAMGTKPGPPGGIGTGYPPICGTCGICVHVQLYVCVCGVCVCMCVYVCMCWYSVFVYVTGWSTVVFGINSTSNAVRKCKIARGEAECYLLPDCIASAINPKYHSRAILSQINPTS